MVPVRTPQGWYHFERDMRYRCVACGDTIDAPPARTAQCRCGNLRFDVENWRLEMRDERLVEGFVVEP